MVCYKDNNFILKLVIHSHNCGKISTLGTLCSELICVINAIEIIHEMNNIFGSKRK